MISAEAISNLEQRIRWNEALDSSFDVALSTSNKAGTSQKHFQRFHQLVSIENIYNVGATDTQMNEEDFNALLSDIRKQSVLQVLNDSIESNQNHVPDFNYSEFIIANAALFDNAIGYGVAISSLELMMSSKRINADERNVKLSVANLKLELEGFSNDYGHVVSRGIRYYYQKAINAISNTLFGTQPEIKSESESW